VPSSRSADTSPGKGESRTFIELARRAQVVAVAIKAIADLGYPAASLVRIAQYAGTSKGVLTYHFDNKEDLVKAVMDDIVARADEYMSARVVAEPSTPLLLRSYIVSNLEFFRDFRNDIVAFLEIYMNARDESGQRLYDLDLVDSSVGPLESLLRDGQARGELGDFDAHMMAIAIRGAIDSITTRVARDLAFDLDQYGEVLAYAFERATAPEEQRGPRRPSRSTSALRAQKRTSKRA
jgi:AcrR family transcriptional regulator